MSPQTPTTVLAEKEAIHLILTGIGDEIYSTVDAFQTTQEIWEAIERLQQGFVTIVKQQHKLDEVSYHKLFDILKQYQNEFNELRAEKLAKNANPLAFMATAQASQDPYYQTPRSHRSSAPSPKPSIPSRSHTTTRHKGKEIAKPITPLSETQRTVNVATARENVGSKVVQQSGIQCFNCKEYGHFAKECRKPKRVKDSAYHKEKMLLCKQAKQGVPLQAEQYDLLANTDEEVDEQELEAHYSYMAKIQEVPTTNSGTDSEPTEQTKQTEFEKYKAFNNCTVHYDKLERKLNEALGQIAHKDTVIREGLKRKPINIHWEEHDIEKMISMEINVGNKMHKAFLLPGESSHWQYKFPLPVKVVPTARRLEMPLPRVCNAIEEMMKKLPVKDRWQLH
nr:hypothetical protein [Tanacetum cinerariifolium]